MSAKIQTISKSGSRKSATHSLQDSVGVFGVVVIGAHEVVGAVNGFGDGGDVGGIRVVGDGCQTVAEVEGYFDDPFECVYLTGNVVCSTVSKRVGDGAGEYLVGHWCLPPGLSGAWIPAFAGMTDKG